MTNRLTDEQLDALEDASGAVTACNYIVVGPEKAGDNWPVGDFGYDDDLRGNAWVTMDSVQGSDTRGETAGEVAALVAKLLAHRDALLAEVRASRSARAAAAGVGVMSEREAFVLRWAHRVCHRYGNDGRAADLTAEFGQLLNRLLASAEPTVSNCR